MEVFAALLVGLAVLILLDKKMNPHSSINRRLLKIARKTATQHAKTLSIKRNQLTFVDDYGNYEDGKWYRHMKYFIEKVVFRDAAREGLTVKHVKFTDTIWLDLEKTIDSVIDGANLKTKSKKQISDVVSGEAYEHLCREILQDHGWRVVTTPATGDQGADLIADLLGKRVVIQCKFYSRPVGNKAVQEVFAAKRFQRAEYAIVVSNSPFTRAAQQLAQTNHVLLMHHDELSDLKANLGPAT